MTHPVAISFAETSPEAIAAFPGRVALVVGAALSPLGRRIDRLTRGALARAMASEAWGKVKPGESLSIGFPAGLACEVLDLVALDRKADQGAARKVGARVARGLGPLGALVVAEGHPRAADMAFGLALRAYRFDYHTEAKPAFGPSASRRCCSTSSESG